MKGLIKPFFLLILGIGRAFSSFAFTPPVNELVQSFEKVTDQAIKDWKIPGLAFAIVTPEKVLRLKTYGLRKAGSTEKIDSNTLFRIASLSKGFSAALSIKLVHQGFFQLQDPIINYLPEVVISDRYLTKKIKIKHLLSHTNGIQEYHLEDLAYTKFHFRDLSKKLVQAKKKGRIGHHFQYQNIIFSLIQPIIEQATGRSFAKNMQQEILLPLAMHHTILTGQAYEQSTNKAYAHEYLAGRYQSPSNSSYYHSTLAAAGIASSITDMSRWLQALLGGHEKTLNQKQLATMFLPVVNVPLQSKRFQDSWWTGERLLSAYYGLGWFIYDYMGNSIVHHSGRLTGFNSLIAFSPEHQIGLVILANSDTLLPGALMAQFFDMLFDLPLTNWSKLLLTHKTKTTTQSLAGKPLLKLTKN
jgi:beta-lactamase class C